MEKTQAQHTPGPWKVSESGDTVVGPRGNVVAECCGYSVEATDSAQRAQGGREANASLIATAPELLAVCERFSAWERDPDRYSGDLADMVTEARAAIARARGEAEGGAM